jgi:hypothetical protein
MQLACDPERLEVRDRPGRGQVAEMLREAEHGGELRDRLLLHLGGRRPPVERVVVRVEQHRGRVGRPGDRGGRLEHLPGIARIGVRVRVVEPPGQFRERRAFGVGRVVGVLGHRAERQQRLRAGVEPRGERGWEPDVARVHAAQRYPARELSTSPILRSG